MSQHNNHSNRTYDGELLSIGLSGITNYDTSMQDPDRKPPVGEILTPQDLAEQLSIMVSLLNSAALKEGIRLLNDHIADRNNPHRVDLDQFMMDIGDALYTEFVRLGGKCSKERYLNSLFNTLYVATLDEMSEPIDRRAIVSVTGATQFMRRHELDPEAHSGLIDSLFPGTPLRDDPIGALYAFTGIPPSMIVDDPHTVDLNIPEYVQVPYSYIGHDGNLYYCDNFDELPMDYINGEPYVPLYGVRINHILESENLIPYTYVNTGVVHNSAVSPDGNRTASSVTSNMDADEVLHMVNITEFDLTQDKYITFSVYAKADDCDKLGISYQDDSGSGVVTVGVFHLTEGYTVVTNPMESRTAKIETLNHGWFRCSITIFNDMGTTGKVSLVFFNGDDTNMAYRATGKTCGYLWGLQLEDGPSVSPYMPTKGVKAWRKPKVLRMPMTIKGDVKGRPKYTVAVGVRGIGNSTSWSNDRVVFSVLDMDGFPTVIARHTDHKSILIERRMKTYTEVQDAFIGTPIHSSSYEIQANPLLQVIHGTDQARIISGANEAISEHVHAHDGWDEDVHLLLGTDTYGNYLDGYLRHALIYTFVVSKGEANFIHGEQINE